MVKFATCMLYWCPGLGVFLFFLSITPPPHNFPPLSPLSPFPPPGQFPPSPAITYPYVPPVSSPSPNTVPEDIAYQCTARTCSAFGKCTPPSSENPPPPLLSPLRCNPTSHMVSSAVAAPSDSTSPITGDSPGPFPYRGWPSMFLNQRAVPPEPRL